MSWLIFALICLFGWGLADLFYKAGSDEKESNTHLKIAVWVGFVMGITAIILLPFSESGLNGESLIKNAIAYLPASIGYIVSMIIGYAGLRYLELSIVSPVQNASGAFSVIAMAAWFTINGAGGSIIEEYSGLEIFGTLFIVVGMIALAIVEQKISNAEVSAHEAKGLEKFKTGALALIFPILYCVFDTLGTAADGIILDEEFGLGLGEIDVLVLYGLTFFLAGIVCYIVLLIKEKKPYNLFERSQMPKAAAAVCEQFGQIFYVFAMAKEPLLAAPMVASYCIVSAILARIFLKEKLKASQYACIAAVIVGIVMLGIADGINA
ncbi:MAG: EamA family transporter [Eubacteriales bacterium]|nr:EamA family transporter [Eubacteriales bacterium]